MKRKQITQIIAGIVVGLVLVWLISLLNVVFVDQGIDTSSWEIYENTEDGYSVVVPPGWHYRRDIDKNDFPGVISRVFFDPEIIGSDEQNLGLVQVMTSTYSQQEIVDSINDDRKIGTTKWSHSRIGGVNARRAELTGTIQSQGDYHAIQYIFEYEGDGYVMSIGDFVDDKNLSPDHLDIFNAMVESFEFLE
jgi:hypothetical protein